MSEWPLTHLTREQAWEFVRTGERGHLSDEAQAELAGLSDFGATERQPELLWQCVDPYLLTNRDRMFDRKQIRAALLRLGFPETDR